MKTQQTRVFRQVLAATGCPATAAWAARMAGRGGRLRLRRRDALPPDAGGKAAEQGPDQELALAELEAEAVRRALAGVQVPVFHQGRECGSTVKHSDQLLMFLLKTLKPERYGAAREAQERTQAGPQNGPLRLDIDLSRADEED